jgi:hypothetical protein
MFHRFWSLLSASLVCGSLTILDARASVEVAVEEMCSETHLATNDFTARAIVPASDSDGCELRWFSSTNPVSGNTTIYLYYGQPNETVELAREEISFAPDPSGGFAAVRRFSKRDLGTQGFVTVLVTSRDELLRWTSWTVRGKALPGDPPPAASLSVDIRLSALHLETARGHFPRSRQAEGVVWQAVGEEAIDYDLDGPSTGSPNIHVVVSNAWTPTDLAPSSVKEALAAQLDRVAGIANHEVKFDDLSWIETQPETIFYEDGTSELERKHFYTVVTIWTDASYRPVGEGQPKRFIHETSAPTWKPGEVTEWSSYVRSEYTADPRLLDLIGDYISAGRAIPGFDTVPLAQSGDGGPSNYSLRFLVRMRPWAPSGIDASNYDNFRAGIESFAVVAARAGVGTARVSVPDEDKSVFCSAFELFCPDNAVAAAELPNGWYREGASSHLPIERGSVPIIQSSPLLAASYASRGDFLDMLRAQYRGVLQGETRVIGPPNDEVLVDASGNSVPLARRGVLEAKQLPTEAYFVVGAKLRAGALVRKDRILLPVYRMIPVNSYAQYVIRTSAIKDQAAVLTGAPTREVTTPSSLGADEIIERRGWFANLIGAFGSLPVVLRALIALAAVAALLGLMWLVSPLRPLVHGIATLIGAVLSFLGRLFR